MVYCVDEKQGAFDESVLLLFPRPPVTLLVLRKPIKMKDGPTGEMRCHSNTVTVFDFLP